MTKNQEPKQKHRLKTEKILLVSLSILVLILTTSLLFVAIKLAVTTTSCNTPGCVIAAAQILTYIDPTADPCDDFFRFACGKYLQDHFGDVEAAPMVQLQKKVERQVEEIIVEPIKDDDHYLIKIQKELLKACLNKTKAENEALPVFQKMLDELHGWPVVVGDQWNEEDFDWKDVVCKLRQKGYAFSMMMTVGPVVDPSNTSRYIIRVEQAYIPSIGVGNKELYKSHMSDVAVIFGAKRKYADEEMEKVLDFMERLRKLGEKNEWKIQNESHHSRGLLTNKYTIEEFQKRFNQINWIDLLKKIMQPAAQISNTDYVIFPDATFLEEFFDLLKKTPKRTQANYIIWIALTNLMPYMPRELQQSGQNKFSPTESSRERLIFCQREISQGFFPDPSKILYVRKYLPVEKRDQIAQLLARIKSELIHLLRKSSWLDDVSKEKSVQKAEALMGVIGAPGDYSNEEELEKFEFGQKTSFDQKSFLEMFLVRLKNVVDATFYRLHKSPQDTKLAPFYNLLTKVLAMNSWTENAIFLPAGILEGIFYDQDRPMYLNYGGIGSVIGHELTHGFGKYGSRFDEDGNEERWWSEETEKGFTQQTKCLLQNAEDFQMANKINGQETLEENIADYTGVKVAYAAYKKWVSEKGEEEHLVGLKYTPYQLFWISSVLHYCYKTNEEASGGTTSKSAEHANNVFRTIVPLQNNADFAKDFKCAVGSRMNPSEKCQIF